MTPTAAAVTAGAAGLLFGALLTPLAIRWAIHLNFLDHAGGYKQHGAATPLLGGLAVAGAAALAMLVYYRVSPPAITARPISPLVGLAAGLAILLPVGVVDDRCALTAGTKLAWQAIAILVAGGIATAAGARLELYLEWPRPVMFGLTLLWILAVTNAVNFIDNMNGACAGGAAIAAVAIGIANIATAHYEVAAAALAIAGACLGFLPANFPRARVFLGDAGSMSLGFALAVLGVVGTYTVGAPTPWLALVTPLLALGMPILDLVVVIGIRIAGGRAPWRGDRAHFAHRLVRRGLSPTAAVVVWWIAAATFAALGLLARQVEREHVCEFLLAVALLALALTLAAGSRGLEPPE